MDASAFESARNSQLTSFQKQYAALKTQYNASLTSALTQSDQATRSNNVSQVLGLNQQIVALIKSFNGTVDPGTCHANPGLKGKLNASLEKYHKDYESIRHGTKQLTSIQDAIATTEEKTTETKKWFSWYAIMVGVSIVVLIFVAVTRVSRSLNTEPSVAVVSGSLG